MDVKQAIDRLEAACADPDGPLYGSDLVEWIGDVIDALRAERERCGLAYASWEQVEHERDRLQRDLDAARAEVEALRDYAQHEGGCVAGQNRCGEPTPDGNYRTLYGYGKHEVWCLRGERPPCSCGLDDILAAHRQQQDAPEGEG